MANKLIELEDGIIVEIQDVLNEIPEAISIEGDKEISKVEKAFQNVENVIVKSADTINNAWIKMNEKMQADKASIEFGLSFTGKGNVYFVEASATANLKITINWDFSKIREQNLNK